MSGLLEKLSNSQITNIYLTQRAFYQLYNTPPRPNPSKLFPENHRAINFHTFVYSWADTHDHPCVTSPKGLTLHAWLNIKPRPRLAVTTPPSGGVLLERSAAARSCCFGRRTLVSFLSLDVSSEHRERHAFQTVSRPTVQRSLLRLLSRAHRNHHSGHLVHGTRTKTWQA